MNAPSRTANLNLRGASRVRLWLRRSCVILPLLIITLGCAQQQLVNLEATIAAKSTVLAKLAETPTPTNTPTATPTPLPTATPTPEPTPTPTPIPPIRTPTPIPSTPTPTPTP